MNEIEGYIYTVTGKKLQLNEESKMNNWTTINKANNSHYDFDDHKTLKYGNVVRHGARNKILSDVIKLTGDEE